MLGDAEALTLIVVLVQIDGVTEVHDLHVWCIKPGMPILAAHVTTSDVKDGEAVLSSVTNYCRSFGINHSTIQVSDSSCCKPASLDSDSHARDHNHEHNHGHSHGDGHSHHGHQHNHTHSHANNDGHHQSSDIV